MKVARIDKAPVFRPCAKPRGKNEGRGRKEEQAAARREQKRSGKAFFGPKAASSSLIRNQS
jgi:hypothetical protein